MSRPKYVIKEIKNMTLIIPEVEVVKQNIPSQIEVSKEEFEEFLNVNARYLNESYVNAPADVFIVKDFYGNIVARHYFYVEKTYYINPELLKLGLEKKLYIENETRIVDENRIDLGVPKSCGLNYTYLKN